MWNVIKFECLKIKEKRIRWKKHVSVKFLNINNNNFEDIDEPILLHKKCFWNPILTKICKVWHWISKNNICESFLLSMTS